MNCQLQLLYSYLKFNGEWLMQQLKISTVELSEYKLLPGQNVKEDKVALLQSMFHIGQQPFDQVKIDNENKYETNAM